MALGKAWRYERHLTIEGQRNGLYSNYLEEATEFFKATNDLNKIDALCDMLVVASNTIDTLDTEKVITPSMEELLCEEATIYAKQPTLAVLATIGNLRTIETMRIDKELDNDTDVEGTYQIFVYRAFLLLRNACEYLGYDFYKAMNETFKQINSRKGYWDDNVKKFIKTTPEAEQYKADYKSCKFN